MLIIRCESLSLMNWYALKLLNYNKYFFKLDTMEQRKIYVVWLGFAQTKTKLEHPWSFYCGCSGLFYSVKSAILMSVN